MKCDVLYCIVCMYVILYCIVLYCIALYCLYCLYCIVLYGISPYIDQTTPEKQHLTLRNMAFMCVGNGFQVVDCLLKIGICSEALRSR